MRRTTFKPATVTLKRTGFLRCQMKEVGAVVKLRVKVKKCAVRECRKEFMPRSMTHKACSPECAATLAEQVRLRDADRAARADRVETKRKLDGMKTIPQLKAEAQTVFNLYVRLRDQLAGHGCICCGKFATAAALAKPGGAYDACHYRSRGSADHLRFDERNVHLGLKDCNTWGHVDYRGGLIRRIGLEAVEALECDQAGEKWTRELLLSIKAKYAAKVRELKTRAV